MSFKTKTHSTSSVQACQNCKLDFTIEPDDFGFYEKIGVPPPTFCPECRLQRRLSFRNERSLYHRECGLCKKSVISMYSKSKSFPVYCHECWWGDAWDPFFYGTEYDWQKPFFLQFRNLLRKIPRPSLIISPDAKNSEYCNYVGKTKECFLCFGSIDAENCLYGSPYESKYCVDTYLVRECEYCYECIDCEKMSNSMFAQDCSSSFNLIHCFDCKNCQDCMGCVGLRGQKYNIFNQPYSKEEYIKNRDAFFARGRKGIDEIKSKFQKLKMVVPHQHITAISSSDISGNHIMQSKNIKKSFDIKRSKDVRFCIRMMDGKDVYDANYCEFMELCYEYIGYWRTSQTKFSNTCGDSNNLAYSDFCSGSSNLFGCIGLRKKSYCILNKQYTKEEYNKLVPKIVEHMSTTPYIDKNGKVYKYGEFSPSELSPFSYNETIAQEFFPLIKKEALKHGYKWKDKEERNYVISIKTEDIPNNISDVEKNTVGRVIECEHKGECNEQCTEAFKIIPSELQFYQRMNLPLPHLCSNCRHYQRLKQRNPFKLWHRRCMCGSTSSPQVSRNHDHTDRCPNEFETSYGPERSEVVYCEKCYQGEVY